MFMFKIISVTQKNGYVLIKVEVDGDIIKLRYHNYSIEAAKKSLKDSINTIINFF